MELRNITKIVRNLKIYKSKINSKNNSLLNETEHELIRYVIKHDGCSLTVVTSFLNVDKALITRICQKLRDLNYIELENNLNDKRKKILHATRKAKELKNETNKEEIDFYNACVAVLSGEEKIQFDELLNKVYLESKRLRKTGFKNVK